MIIICDGSNSGEMFQGFNGVLASTMGKIKHNNELDSRFLHTFLDFQFYLFNSKKTGAAIPHLDQSLLYSLEIPLPPLPEQKRIVSILDKSFEAIEKAKENAEKNLQNSKELIESYLNAAFTEGRGEWPKKSLKEVCAFENGDRGKNYPNRKEYVSSGIPWINTGHIQPDGTLSQNEMNYISRKKFDTLRSGKIREGDLVYCLRGATLGKTALVEPFTQGAVASSLVIIRPCESLNRHFLFYFLISPHGQGKIKEYQNGAAQPNLGAKSVAKFVITLPPLSEQEVIINRIKHYFETTRCLESIYLKKIVALDELKQSLLSKAFAGEL